MSSADTIVQDFTERNYTVKLIKTDNLTYGLPGQRIRLVGGLLNNDSTLFKHGNEAAIFKNVVKLLAAFHHKAPDIRNVVLETGHPAVQAELARKSMLDYPREDPAEMGWPELHMKTCMNKFNRWGTLQCDSTSRTSPWWPFTTTREREVLADEQKTHGKSVTPDVSQSMGRVPKAKVTDGVMHMQTLLPNSKPWLGFLVDASEDPRVP